MNRQIISDSRSVENMPDHTLRSEVQPVQQRVMTRDTWERQNITEHCSPILT